MGALYVWALHVSTLCVTTLWEHSMCDNSMWALYVCALYGSTLCVSTLCPPPQKHHHKNTSMCEQHVWARCVGTLCVSTLCEHEHRKVRKLPQKMYISSWARCCRTPKSRKITTKNEHHGPYVAQHRKARELPRKMNIEEVEEPKKYENLQTKPVLDPFKSTADTRKVRELPRKINIEEVEKPETTKICRQKPRASVPATPKLREFTDETNMQARNHENNDECRARPVRYLDLDTPAFYYYRKNPKCYHTVWGIILYLPLSLRKKHVNWNCKKSVSELVWFGRLYLKKVWRIDRNPPRMDALYWYWHTLFDCCCHTFFKVPPFL